MADAKLSALTAVATPATSDLVYVAQGGVSKKETIAQILSLITAPGSTTQVVFNDAGAYAGDAGMTYNKTTDSLTLAGTLTAGGDVVIGTSVVALIKMGDGNNFFRLVRTTGPGGFSGSTGAYEQVGVSGDVFILSGPSGSPLPASHVMASKTMVGPTQSNQPAPSALSVFQVDNTDGTTTDVLVRAKGVASQSGDLFQGRTSADATVFSVSAAGRVTTPVVTGTGTGSPEGAVTAGVGSLYLRTDGGANTTLYIKESGSGNTGWVAK